MFFCPISCCSLCSGLPLCVLFCSASFRDKYLNGHVMLDPALHLPSRRVHVSFRFAPACVTLRFAVKPFDMYVAFQAFPSLLLSRHVTASYVCGVSSFPLVTLRSLLNHFHCIRFKVFSPSLFARYVVTVRYVTFQVSPLSVSLRLLPCPFVTFCFRVIL